MLFSVGGSCMVVSDDLLHNNKADSSKEMSAWIYKTLTCANRAIKPSANIGRSFCSTCEGGSCSSSLRDMSCPQQQKLSSLVRKMGMGCAYILSSTLLTVPCTLHSPCFGRMILAQTQSSSARNLKSLDATITSVDLQKKVTC